MADLYRDVLTLRQVWVRLVALRKMPEFTPLDEVLDEQHEKAELRRETDAVDSALAPFLRGG